MRNLLGGKGANLAEMTNLGLPVPPGFTITTEVCTALLRQRRDLPGRARGRGRGGAGGASRRRVGAGSATPTTRCSSRVRSGARVSMPGMMDTILNLGLNDDTVAGPRRSSPATRASPTTATAASSRCTATSCSASTHHQFEERRSSQEATTRGVEHATPSSAEDDCSQDSSSEFKAIVEQRTGKPFPEDP